MEKKTPIVDGIHTVIGMKTIPDVFDYLDHMITNFEIVSFTLVPYVPRHYEIEGTVSEDEIPAPRVFSTYLYDGHGFYSKEKKDWRDDVNAFFKNHMDTWSVLEIGISSRVETSDGHRHMLMLDLSGRGYPNKLEARDVVNDVIPLYISSLDANKFVLANSGRSYHLYYYGGLLTETEWQAALHAALLPEQYAPVFADARWIGNVLFKRGYGIVRASAITSKYSHLPRLILSDSPEIQWKEIPKNTEGEPANEDEIDLPF